MGALTKYSIWLLPAIVTAGYLYISSSGEDFDAARSDPHREICKQDGDRLARLQAQPSLDEAVRFGSELRCLKLWPQVLAVLDGVSQEPGSTAASSANDASPPPAMEATSAASDDACKQDEDRLAELQAKPSADDATRFDSELRCSRLRPQLPAMLKVTSDPADLAGSSLPHSGAVSTDASAGANGAPPAADAARDADFRIAALERERDALAAEVGRLEREQAAPAPPQSPIPAERSDLEPALASLPDGMPPRVLIRYLERNGDARRGAESVAKALTAQGVEVADLRASAAAVRTELSFSYAPDEAIALRVGRLAGVAPVRRPQPKDGLMAPPGTVELSLSGDRRLAVIATSRKESNRE